MNNQVIAIPVDMAGIVDPRWGKARMVAICQIQDHNIVKWSDIQVDWDRLHDQDGEGAHHARVAKFLMEHHVTQVMAHHMGPGMAQMLDRMGIKTVLGVSGPARVVVESSRG